MNRPADKIAENKTQSVAHEVSLQQDPTETPLSFKDHRPEAAIQRRLQKIVHNSHLSNPLVVLQNVANKAAQAKQAAQLQAISNASSRQPVLQRYYVQNPKTLSIRWEDTQPVPVDYTFQIGTYQGDHGVNPLYLDSSVLDAAERVASEAEETEKEEELDGKEEVRHVGPPLPALVYEPGGNHRVKNKLNVREGEGISAALDDVLTLHTDLINGYLTKGRGAEIGTWKGTHWEFALPNGVVYMTHEQSSRSPNQLIPLRGPGIASLLESGLKADVFLSALNIARNYAKVNNFVIKKGEKSRTKEEIQTVLSMLKHS